MTKGRTILLKIVWHRTRRPKIALNYHLSLQAVSPCSASSSMKTMRSTLNNFLCQNQGVDQTCYKSLVSKVISRSDTRGVMRHLVQSNQPALIQREIRISKKCTLHRPLLESQLPMKTPNTLETIFTRGKRQLLWVGARRIAVVLSRKHSTQIPG